MTERPPLPPGYRYLESDEPNAKFDIVWRRSKRNWLMLMESRETTYGCPVARRIEPMEPEPQQRERRKWTLRAGEEPPLVFVPNSETELEIIEYRPDDPDPDACRELLDYLRTDEVWMSCDEHRDMINKCLPQETADV